MKKVDEQARGDKFCQQVTTGIWKETPDPHNPYHTAEARCHGYEHLALANNRSFSDVLYLLFRSELPEKAEAELFERLLISVIHPGPRHPACKAIMSAAVSKTNVRNFVPLALTMFSGEWMGSHEVFKAMRFLEASAERDPQAVAAELCQAADTDAEGDITLAPGFGSLYGSADSYAQRLADNLASDGQYSRWAQAFVAAIADFNAGYRTTGVFAAVMADLGFTPYQGEMIYQIASAPGLAAQADEKRTRPLTDMPFISDENYVIE